MCDELLREWPDGRSKLWVISRVLAWRGEKKELFQRGSYVPVHGNRAHERHVIGFARMFEKGISVTVTPRFAYTLMNGEMRWPLGESWGDAEIVLPAEATNQTLRNLLTGEVVRVSREHTLSCAEVFRSFPVALLASES